MAPEANRVTSCAWVTKWPTCIPGSIWDQLHQLGEGNRCIPVSRGSEDHLLFSFEWRFVCSIRDEFQFVSRVNGSNSGQLSNGSDGCPLSTALPESNIQWKTSLLTGKNLGNKTLLALKWMAWGAVSGIDETLRGAVGVMLQRNVTAVTLFWPFQVFANVRYISTHFRGVFQNIFQTTLEVWMRQPVVPLEVWRGKPCEKTPQRQKRGTFWNKCWFHWGDSCPFILSPTFLGGNFRFGGPVFHKHTWKALLEYVDKELLTIKCTVLR